MHIADVAYVSSGVENWTEVKRMLKQWVEHDAKVQLSSRERVNKTLQ